MHKLGAGLELCKFERHARCVSLPGTVLFGVLSRDPPKEPPPLVSLLVHVY